MKNIITRNNNRLRMNASMISVSSIMSPGLTSTSPLVEIVEFVVLPKQHIVFVKLDIETVVGDGVVG